MGDRCEGSLYDIINSKRGIHLTGDFCSRVFLQEVDPGGEGLDYCRYVRS